MEEGPVTLEMDDYSGFEKVGPLGTSLPASNSQTTTQAGDIVLYQGNQIVMFYGSNSWSYTRTVSYTHLKGDFLRRTSGRGLTDLSGRNFRSRGGKYLRGQRVTCPGRGDGPGGRNAPV